MALTSKQKVFVDEYLVDLNATRAYKVAYKSCKKDETARANSSRLLTNANVKEYIDQRMVDRQKRTEITQDKVLKELARIGFANGTDFAKVIEKKFMQPIYNDEGELIDEKECRYKAVEVIETEAIDKDKLPAIAGIKTTKDGIEVKMNDKVKALELIGRHLGMFNDKVEVKNTIETSIAKLSEEEIEEELRKMKEKKNV